MDAQTRLEFNRTAATIRNTDAACKRKIPFVRLYFLGTVWGTLFLFEQTI